MSDSDQPLQIVIAGCGRVGAGLATALVDDGHAVSVVDRDERAFKRLGEDFPGTCIRGIAFDRATMVRAGVEQAYAFVAVTSGDNSNIVAARTAKEHFGVPTAVARIYDPPRAEIYERYGVTTIATARWTIDAIVGHLNAGTGKVESSIGPGEGDVVVLTAELPGGGAGPWQVESFARQGRWLLAAITRTGQTTVPVPRQLVQGGERVHLAVQRGAIEEAEAFLAGLAEGV